MSEKTSGITGPKLLKYAEKTSQSFLPRINYMKVEKRKITEICEVQVCNQSETVCILYTVPDLFLLYTFKAQFTSHDLHNLKMNILNERYIYLFITRHF